MFSPIHSIDLRDDDNVCMTEKLDTPTIVSYSNIIGMFGVWIPLCLCVCVCVLHKALTPVGMKFTA